VTFLPVTAEGSSSTTPSNDNYRLVVASMDYSIYIFNVNDQCLIDWNEQMVTTDNSKNAYPTTELHKYYPYDYPLRISTNPQTPSKLLVVRNIVVFSN
jgi:hypothetical protein